MAGKTTLTKERAKTIIELYKTGLDWRSIAKHLGVSEVTLLKWRNDNTLGLHDDIERNRRELLLQKAEDVLDELLTSEEDAVRAKVAQFLGETLGKKWYSKQDNTVINVMLPTPILDLGKLVSTIPEKPLLNKDNTE